MSWISKRIDWAASFARAGMTARLAVCVAAVIGSAAVAPGAAAQAASRPGAGAQAALPRAAQAASRPGPVAQRRIAAAAPVISTIAGGDGGPAKGTTVSMPSTCGLAYHGGNLYSGDTGTLRQLNTGTDQLTPLAGTEETGPLVSGGLASNANLRDVCGVTVDHAGNLVFGDEGPPLRDPKGLVLVLAAKTGTFYGQAMTAGHVYAIVGGGSGGLGGPALDYKLGGAPSITVDAAGNLVIADGLVLVVAAKTGTFYGQAMTAGHIYSVAGGGDSSADGIPATQATISATAVALDGAGNLVIADIAFHRIRVVAESTGTFYGQAMTAGDIYTVAGTGIKGFSGDGGLATKAQLNTPEGLVLDGAGNMVVSDTGNDRVRVIAAKTGTFYGTAMTARHIYTVAGTGVGGFTGDGGPATKADLGGPVGATIDGAGNIAFADLGNDRVRVIAAKTGTFYGQAMTTGDIYTVAGTGVFGFSGDAGPATAAVFDQPAGVAVDGAGGLAIASRCEARSAPIAAIGLPPA